EIGGDRQVGNAVAGRAQLFEVARAGVATVHGGERAVAPGLQRQVEVLAHRGRLRHRRDRLRPKVLRVRAGETDTPDPVDGADGTQKFGEQRTAPGDVAPVGVDVL